MSAFPDFPQIDNNWEQYTVDTSRSGCIQSAIDNAPDNSIIVIPEGVYSESIRITKRVQIYGAVGGKVTIQSPASEDPITLDSPFAVVRNLILSPGKSQSNSLINYVSGVAVIDKCYLETELLPPIVTKNNGTLYFSECSIYAGSSSIIYAAGNLKVEFRSCLISSKKSVGIMAMGNSIVRLIQCDIAGCGDSGIICLDTSTLQIDSTKVSANVKDGIEMNTTSKENYIVNSTLYGNVNGCAVNGNGKGILQIQRCTIAGCLSGIVINNGFTVTSAENQYSEMSESFYAVTNSSVLSLNSDTLTGQCTCAVYGNAGSLIQCNQSSFSQLSGTGISVSDKCRLEVANTQFEGIKETAIEAYNNVQLTIASSVISDCESIGLQIQNNVVGTITGLQISRSQIAQLFFVDCPSNEFKFESCAFDDSEGTCVLTSNTKATFEGCDFSNSKSSGIELKSDTTEPIFKSCRFVQNAESGACVNEKSKSKFIECTFMSNGVCGVSVEGSQPDFNSCVFASNGQFGAAVTQGSKTNFTKCSFKGNVGLAAQIENSGTRVTITECDISEQAQAGGIIVNDGAKTTFERSLLHDNQSSHIEARNNGAVTIKGCEMYSSQKGIGVMIHMNGNATITETNIHDEQQSGIVIGDRGYADITKSVVANNGIGIYLLTGSNATIKGNHIHDNSKCGVQILGGMPQVIENTIENHSLYGVNISAGAEPQIERNVFKNNDQLDVNRE